MLAIFLTLSSLCSLQLQVHVSELGYIQKPLLFTYHLKAMDAQFLTNAKPKKKPNKLVLNSRKTNNSYKSNNEIKGLLP
ncbi:hypothetical protein THF1D04_60135 [Vibrio owensii]|uniref:Uncharacterized protein n=1 Tax=Vibrio owensii TaxID=696485 RepID=A0AAU9QDM2_9VIBR|nr:hypothetical protein THF1D04_60135 [Vibrio owensii]